MNSDLQMSQYKQSNISSRDNNNEFTEAQTDANDVTIQTQNQGTGTGQEIRTQCKHG